MKKLILMGLCSFAFVALPLAAKKCAKSNIGKGFYKDLFMDSGINLTSRTNLPAAKILNLSMEEFISCTPANQWDSVYQNMMLAGYPGDENGVLLYPDGAPRFRAIYVNGGLANSHGRSLTPKGAQNYKDYIKAGGSYVGTCAGAYLTSTGVYSPKNDSIHHWPYYLGIWPGVTSPSGLVTTKTHMTIEKNSPLLKYYDFGGDMKIENVYHNGGCYADEEHEWPKGTEVLTRFDTKHMKIKRDITGKPVIWAWKENEMTGRILPCGSHPEGETSGERMQLMSAMLQYAMEGNGLPRIKAELKWNEERKMTASTHDNKPEFTKIGDLQYHHFTFEVPKGVDTLQISLKSLTSWDKFDLYLNVSQEEFAWMDNSIYQLVTPGVDKTLDIPAPKAGKYTVSVYCATTVTSVESAMGTQYTGRLDVLNGVPYIIKVGPKAKEETKKKAE